MLSLYLRSVKHDKIKKIRTKFDLSNKNHVTIVTEAKNIKINSRSNTFQKK